MARQTTGPKRVLAPHVAMDSFAPILITVVPQIGTSNARMAAIHAFQDGLGVTVRQTLFSTVLNWSYSGKPALRRPSSNLR